jgi:hypothetical protein
MKPDRRHELSQNVLGMKLSETVSFLKRNGTRLAWGVLIAALVVLIGFYVVNKRRQRHDESHAEFNALMIAAARKGDDWFSRMKALADQTSDKPLAALATLALGDAYSSQAAEGRQGDIALLTQPPAEAAAEYYRKVIGSFPDEHLAVARAHEGRARLAIARGDMSAAEAEYDAIIGMPGLAGHPLVALAREAKENLQELAEPVRMATTKPSTQPASRAATQPAPVGSAATRPAARP